MTPEDKKYFDAKNDVIKAFKSVSELNQWQKEHLAKELLGVEAAVTMYSLMRQHSNGR